MELAKESFLERLKREREENQTKKESTCVITPNQEFPKVNVPDNFCSKGKYKKFSDLELNLDTDSVESKKRKIKEDENVSIIETDESSTNVIEIEKESSFVTDAEIKTKKTKSIKKSKNEGDDKNFEKPEICESERIRQLSFKQKLNALKSQKQTIRKALRSVSFHVIFFIH